MRAIQALAIALLLGTPAAHASEEADDWKLIGGILALVQQIVHQAANSPDPAAAQKSVESILSGGNEQANRIAASVTEEMLSDVPPEQRGVIAAIGRDLFTLARREQARAAAQPGVTAQPVAAEPSRDDALQARKDLHGMGLRYWDEQQFLEAVRRGDRIAVDLFLAAKGLQGKAGN
ncbi:MAG: hypothetical protein IT513_00210 [Burkholderiales bacterium]|nr:hypothetical protein [Burkholderiales bacterium]